MAEPWPLSFVLPPTYECYPIDTVLLLHSALDRFAGAAYFYDVGKQPWE
jgi:hypothetical protein